METRCQGFALPLAMGLGFVMMVLGLSTMLVAQSDRTSAFNRKEAGASLAAAEGGIARSLAQLTAPNNAVLLNRNFDTINPKTGKTYLGPDGRFNSGDEEANAIDEWTGYDPSSTSCHQQKAWGSPNLVTTGSIGETGTYTITAYRFNPLEQKGTLFVEASQDGKTTGVVISISVTPDLSDFPGVVLIEPTGNPDSTYATGVLALRGRELQGSKANVYYHPSSSVDPSLTASAGPEDADRGSYLNAIWSSTLDGVSEDTVQGNIFACTLRPNLPVGEVGTDLGTIDDSLTITGVGGKTPTYFTVDQIDLSGEEVLTVDTTNGPVQIDISNTGGHEHGITLRESAKILNVRTDGQPSRVGDLRIIARKDDRVTLYDQTCIQNAFLWFPYDELRLLTTGPGCPGRQNTNVEGVLWMEAILSSKNEATHRDVKYLGYGDGDYDKTTKSGVTSGITVPEDVTSLLGLLKYIDWPARYRFGGVLQWQRVRL
ncbi:hypothetical protein [Acaryochloris sp. IP29b_bin.148]|uniref:hypothetical protein n=1 Tax=Acaryochloris sp. IP29b_bin.148 TaxID=2969218 RepID=UPI00261E61AC|nr:hypothetical protein [Acaryochloris sp. IP29b_bin.148]